MQVILVMVGLSVAGLIGAFFFTGYLIWMGWDPGYRVRRAERICNALITSRENAEATNELSVREMAIEKRMSRLSLVGLAVWLLPMAIVAKFGNIELWQNAVWIPWCISSVVGAIVGGTSGMKVLKSHRAYEYAVLRRSEPDEVE